MAICANCIHATNTYKKNTDYWWCLKTPRTIDPVTGNILFKSGEYYQCCKRNEDSKCPDYEVGKPTRTTFRRRIYYWWNSIT